MVKLLNFQWILELNHSIDYKKGQVWKDFQGMQEWDPLTNWNLDPNIIKLLNFQWILKLNHSIDSQKGQVWKDSQGMEEWDRLTGYEKDLTLVTLTPDSNIPNLLKLVIRKIKL
ncbi:hypothetical protein L1887_15192 [Cichorium endivia]|nr:hypothetical protein L1887_15192 [Cichorium endivia]